MDRPTGKRYDLIDYRILETVIDYYEQTESCIETSHTRHLNSSGDEMSLQRFGRAMSNVSDGDAPATYSRFAIWGADLNCLVENTMHAVNNSDKETAINKLKILLRNVRAFADCCSLIDSQPGHMQFDRPTEILDQIKNNMENFKENNNPKHEYLYSRLCESIDKLKSKEEFRS